MAEPHPYGLSESAQRIRDAAEQDLATFIRLVAPRNVMGSVHEEMCLWMNRQDRKRHQLVLMPRDHGKSRYMAYRVAHRITIQPDVRVLYISATTGLAEKQLKFIKDILTSDTYRRYWPEMINENEGQREKWTNTEISIDHPKRKFEGVRDPTVFTGGLNTSLTGLHCDVAVLDDIVVAENAYTEDGRQKVETQYSFLASIEGADGEEWVTGTRYHPKDLYSKMQSMKEDIFDESGEIVDSEEVYEIFERQVESRGDGTGEFLWPKQQRADGKWFGFDAKVLATKKAKYLDRTQFRAQYYNDPNDPGDLRIGRDKFQYYDPKHLTQSGGHWYYHGRRLNIFASVDFAYTTNKRSDYTAIAVIGIDAERSIFVLEIERFKTSRVSEMFEHIQQLHVKWDFRKLAAEVTSGQNMIVQELKESYIKPFGLGLSIIEVKHNRQEGSKQERISAALEPRYDNMAMWHYRGGNCQVLEDELISQHPPHDDCIDALATVVTIAVPPVGNLGRDRMTSNVIYSSRFGGVAF